MAKIEVLQRCMEALREAIPDLRGVLLASNEGLPIAHALLVEPEPSRLAALAAAAVGISNKVTGHLEMGDLGEVSITGSQGSLFVYSVGPRAVLAILSPSSANAGLIHLEARGVVEEWTQILTPRPVAEAVAV